MKGHLRFWRGDRLYQIAPAHGGEGYVGVCNGRVVATAPDPASVMRAVIKTGVWPWQSEKGSLVANIPLQV